MESFDADETLPPRAAEEVQPMKSGRGFVVIAAVAVLLFTLLILEVRSSVVRGRGAPVAAFAINLLWVFIAAAIGAGSARLPAGARHTYNFHYLSVLGAFGIGWVFASDFGHRFPFAMSALAPGAAACAVGLIAAAAIPIPRAAAAIAACVTALLLVPLRPFGEPVANVAMLIAPVVTAMWMSMELHKTPPANAGFESPASRIGSIYVAMNVVLAAWLIPVLAMLAWDLFRNLFMSIQGDLEGGGHGAAGWNRMFEISDPICRVVLANAVAAGAAALASRSWLRTSDLARAGAAAACAGCGALLGGQTRDINGLVMATIGGIMIALGTGFGLGGGVHGRRWHRPWLAAGIAWPLSLNLVEPHGMSIFGSGPAAVAATLEGLVAAVLGGAIYWFVINKVRAFYPKPARWTDQFPPAPAVPPKGPRVGKNAY